MDELAKAIQTKYIEDLTAKYPLHRFIMLFLFLISMYTYSVGDSFIGGVRDLKLSFIFDFEKGIIEKTSILELLACLILTKCASYLYLKTNEKFFFYLAKKGNFDKYTNELESELKDVKSGNNLLNYYLSQDISKELEKKRVIIKCMNINGEYAITIALIIFYGVTGWGIADILFFIASIIYMFYVFIKSFKYYVEQFMPNYVAEKVLLGANAKFGDK